MSILVRSLGLLVRVGGLGVAGAAGLLLLEPLLELLQPLPLHLLDVDALLGALLLAEHAALAVAEEAPGAGGRRRRSGGAEARGERGQRGPHRHVAAGGLGLLDT